MLKIFLAVFFYNTGELCYFGNQSYPIGHALDTGDDCLNCTCKVPPDFTCKRINCPWNEVGYNDQCEEIRKPKVCCPEYKCSRKKVLKQLLKSWKLIEEALIKDNTTGPECDCEWKYLKHYEVKGCHPVYANTTDKDESECNCPKRFDCSTADEVNVGKRACFFRKHVYPIYSEINTTNPCQKCFCEWNYLTRSPAITCSSGACGGHWDRLPKGCYKVYKEKECCPADIECRHEESENTTKEMPYPRDNIPRTYTNDPPICEYNGKMYYKGQRIYPDDPCIKCICNENWTGIGSKSCWKYDCMIERHSWQLKRGCIPIYHKDMCCPLKYHCPNKNIEFGENTTICRSKDKDDMCYFDGRYYPVGHVLDIKHQPNCVNCICKIPPDFTCIERSCPPPTNGDHGRCRYMYRSHPNACCPGFRCIKNNGDIVIDDCGKDIHLLCQFKNEMDIFPVNEEEWQNFCKDVTSVLKCMAEYNKKCDRNQNFKDATKDSLLWSNPEGILNALHPFCFPPRLFYKDFVNELQCYSDFAEDTFGLPVVMECFSEKEHDPVHKQALTNVNITDLNYGDDITYRNETHNTHICTDYFYVTSCLLLKLEEECGTYGVIHAYAVLKRLAPLNGCLKLYISSEYFYTYRDLKWEETQTDNVEINDTI